MRIYGDRRSVARLPPARPDRDRRETSVADAAPCRVGSPVVIQREGGCPVRLMSKLTLAVAGRGTRRGDRRRTTGAAASRASTAQATPGASQPSAGRLLVSGLHGTIGGTIGPDGALYVPEGRPRAHHAGRSRARARTSTFADGLPKQVIPLGGVMDVAFVGRTAYALVTLVSPDVGGTSVDGIYRIDARHARHGHRRHRCVVDGPSSEAPSSRCRPASSTRSNPSRAASSSPTATTTGC